MEGEASSSRGKSRGDRSEKRLVISSACSACQKRKSKCDGNTPRCGKCAEKNTECKYDTDDLRRIANLRSINQKLEESLSKYKDLVVRLQQAPIEDAEDLLRQLRGSNDPPISTSPSPVRLVSPGGGGPPSPDFRGITWHPALRIHISSASKPESSGRSRSISTASVWKDPESPSPHNVPSPHVELFGNFTTSTGLATAGFSDTIQLQQSHRVPIHFVQSSVIVEDSPLSRVYTDYRDAARQLLAGGAPLADVLGSLEFVNVELYFRGRQDDPFSANFWACEALKSFTEFGHTVKLGQIVLLSRLMRWTIHPTAETYENTPEMIRPTPTQLLVPHVPAIDIVPIPAMRDALIFNFRDWITITSQTMHLEWPHPPEKCIELDRRSGCRRLTTKFEEFATNPEHWTFDRDILKVFPELEGKLLLRDDGLATRTSELSFVEAS